MWHLFLQAPGAAVTTSGAPGRWMQTQPVPPSPTWETQAPWSWGGVVAQPLLRCCWVWHCGWLSPGQGAFPTLGTRPLRAGSRWPWHRPLLTKAGQSLSCGVDTGLESPRVCVPAHFSQQEFVPGLDRHGEESQLLRAEHTQPLVPLLLLRSRGETAETALALVSPPPTRSCPIYQGHDVPRRHHTTAPVPAPWLPRGCGRAGAVARCQR